MREGPRPPREGEPVRENRQRRRDDQGAAAVEFALVLPLLVLLILAIISFGYMLSFRQAISQAAAEGARAAAVAPAGLGDTERSTRAREAVNDALNSYGVTCAGSVLERDGATVGSCTIGTPSTCTTGTEGECVEVTLDYAYRDHPLLPGFIVGAMLPENLRYATEVRVS